MTFHCRVIPFALVPRRDGLRRPRLLVAAAKAGQAGWLRRRDLRKLLRTDELPSADRALAALRGYEEAQNEARLNRAPDYNLQRHILLLIAILAETRALRDAQNRPISRETTSRAHP